MISYFFRLIWVVLKGLMDTKTGIDQPSSLSLRAWPWDVDTNGHLNNGRYLTWMDFGRLYMVARAGWLFPVFKHKAQPLVAASQLRHFRSVPAFGRVTLYTHLVAWDAKWFYFEHKIFYKENLAAVGMIKGVMADAAGPISTLESLAWSDFDKKSPPLPLYFKKWLQGERSLIDALKKERKAS